MKIVLEHLLHIFSKTSTISTLRFLAAQALVDYSMSYGIVMQEIMSRLDSFIDHSNATVMDLEHFVQKMKSYLVSFDSERRRYLRKKNALRQLLIAILERGPSLLEDVTKDISIERSHDSLSLIFGHFGKGQKKKKKREVVLGGSEVRKIKQVEQQPETLNEKFSLLKQWELEHGHGHGDGDQQAVLQDYVAISFERQQQQRTHDLEESVTRRICEASYHMNVLMPIDAKETASRRL